MTSRLRSLRVQLAVSHALFALALMVLATVIAERSADQDRREEALQFAQHNAEVLAARLSSVWTDPTAVDTLVQLESSVRRSAAAVAATGTVIARTGDDPVQRMGQDHWQAAVNAALNADSAEAANGPWVLAVAPVKLQEDVVGVAAVVERIPPITPWKGPLRLALGFGLLLVVVAGVGGWLLAGRIARPLRRLTETARAIALGRPAEVGTGGSSVAEIATLTAAVDRVGQRLDQLERSAVERDEADRTALRRIAHAVRTPLAVLALRVDELTDEHLEPSRRDALVEVLTRQLDALEDAATHLNELARGDRHVVMARVDLAEVVRGAARRITPLARWSGVRLVVDAPRSPAVGLAVEASVRDAVGNLLENAVKFTPRGGRIAARVEAGDGEVAICVDDSGPGVEEAERDLVARAGVRGSASAGTPGSGLGLALVAATAAECGGRLELGRSALGGLAVRLVIPAPA